MHIFYSFDNGILKYVVIGQYDFEEVYPIINESLKDPHFLPGTNFLIDVTQSISNRSTEDAYGFIDFLGSRDEFKGSKIAVVTPRPTSYGLARIVSVYLEELAISLEVFRDLADAEQWLKNK